MPAFRTLDDVNVSGKRVVIRLDLNVPVKDGVVTDTTRIDRVVPTLQELLKKGAEGPRTLGNDTQTITVSAGVVCRVPAAGEGAEALLRDADAALYRAKRDGRNCVRE